MASIYISSYGLYNAGFLSGAWYNFSDFKSIDELMKKAAEVCKSFGDSDPELMIQDYKGFPRCFYSEYSITEECFDFVSFCKENPSLKDAAEAYVEYFGQWNEEDFNDRYIGCYTDDEFGTYCIEECCLNIPEWLISYIDTERYGREEKWNYNCQGDYIFA